MKYFLNEYTKKKPKVVTKEIIAENLVKAKVAAENSRTRVGSVLEITNVLGTPLVYMKDDVWYDYSSNLTRRTS